MGKITVYHGTTANALRGILSRGLVPGRGRRNHKQSSASHVYVERSKAAARSWATQAGGREYVVIEMEVPEEMLTADAQTLSGTAMRADHIPADCIVGWEEYALSSSTGKIEYMGWKRP